MAEDSFWERSWKAPDREELSLYLESLDDSADPVIAFLHERMGFPRARKTAEKGRSQAAGLRILGLADFNLQDPGFMCRIEYKRRRTLSCCICFNAWGRRV